MENQDLDLIQKCRQGSKEAFDEIVIKYQKKIFNVAYGLLNNYDEASDVAQEVFVRAYAAIKNFRQESALFTWLYRIAVNLSKNRLKVLNRERKRLKSLEDPIEQADGEVKMQIPDAKFSPSQSLDRKEKEEAVRAALCSLENELKEIIILRDIDNLSYEEIARILRINVGTVKSRLHYARMSLKDRLKGVFS